MILYLNYSGVLHRTGMVDMTADKPDQKFRMSAFYNLFLWAPVLENILNECDPDKKINIVLNTGWAHLHGWQQAAEYLPVGLKNRVIGCTSANLTQFSIMNSFRLIEAHAENHGYQEWLAIDHESDGWNEANRGRLVLTQGATGLSTEKAQVDLKQKLKAMLQ